MKNIVFLVIISLFSFNTVSFAQTSTNKEKGVNERIEELEKKVENIEINKENLNNFYNNAVNKKENELQDTFIDAKNEVVSKVNSIQEDTCKNFYSIIAATLVVLSTIGVSYKYLKDKLTEEAENKIKKELHDKINTIIEDNKNTIINLVNKYNSEKLLIHTKKIVVISNDLISYSKIERFLKELDVKNISFILLEDSDIKSEIKKYDLILFDNNNGLLKDKIKDFKAIILNFNDDYKQCFIYFGLPNTKHDDANNTIFTNRNINFANSEFTLYSRIIETLKTQEILNNPKG
jgi:hypothetical protein